MFVADSLGETSHRGDIEVVDLHRDPGAAELGDQFGGLLDRFRSVVVGLLVAGHAAATGADHRRSGLAERRGDAAPGTARGPGHHGHPTAQRISCPESSP